MLGKVVHLFSKLVKSMVLSAALITNLEYKSCTKKQVNTEFIHILIKFITFKYLLDEKKTNIKIYRYKKKHFDFDFFSLYCFIFLHSFC